MTTQQQAIEALNYHRDLKDRINNPTYQEYLAYFMYDVGQSDAAKVSREEFIRTGVRKDRTLDYERGEIFQRHQTEALTMAETYYVSADMVELAQFAGRTVDDTAKFTQDLWPSTFGFVWLEKPAYVNDLWGRTIGTKAVVWTRHAEHGHPGVLVSEYNDILDMQDSNSREFRENNILENKRGGEMGRLHLTHYQWIPFDEEVGPATIPAPHAPKRLIEHGVQEGWERREDGTADNTRRWIMSMLLLMNQTLVTTERHNLMPKNPKHARRLTVPAQVTVITLRRKSSSERPEGVSEVEWHSRWVVRGHWRNQPCGPTHPLAQEVSPGVWIARIWINAYIKGPDGAPFKTNPKVTALTR